MKVNSNVDCGSTQDQSIIANFQVNDLIKKALLLACVLFCASNKATIEKERSATRLKKVVLRVSNYQRCQDEELRLDKQVL